MNLGPNGSNSGGEGRLWAVGGSCPVTRRAAGHQDRRIDPRAGQDVAAEANEALGERGMARVVLQHLPQIGVDAGDLREHRGYGACGSAGFASMTASSRASAVVK